MQGDGSCKVHEFMPRCFRGRLFNGDKPQCDQARSTAKGRGMTRVMPDWPAALRLDQAAAYSGLCPETFKSVCPVKPIRFTDSARGQRYLRASLDSWLSSLEQDAPKSPGRRFGDNICGRAGETHGT